MAISKEVQNRINAFKEETKVNNGGYKNIINVDGDNEIIATKRDGDEYWKYSLQFDPYVEFFANSKNGEVNDLIIRSDDTVYKFIKNENLKVCVLHNQEIPQTIDQYNNLCEKLMKTAQKYDIIDTDVNYKIEALLNGLGNNTGNCKFVSESNLIKEIDGDVAVDFKSGEEEKMKKFLLTIKNDTNFPKNKPFGIGVPGHIVSCVVERGEDDKNIIYVVDQGGMKHQSLKKYFDAISNNTSYHSIKQDNALKIKIANKEYNLPIFLWCRDVFNLFIATYREKGSMNNMEDYISSNKKIGISYLKPYEIEREDMPENDITDVGDIFETFDKGQKNRPNYDPRSYCKDIIQNHKDVVKPWYIKLKEFIFGQDEVQNQIPEGDKSNKKNNPKIQLDSLIEEKGGTIEVDEAIYNNRNSYQRYYNVTEEHQCCSAKYFISKVEEKKKSRRAKIFN
jgi:hypothetical protein